MVSCVRSVASPLKPTQSADKASSPASVQRRPQVSAANPANTTITAAAMKPTVRISPMVSIPTLNSPIMPGIA